MRNVKVSFPKSNENDWARGCDKCKFGIVSAPELTGAASLYLERMVQAIDGDLHFCDCRAGTRYRASLLNRRQMLIEEARRDPRMVEYAKDRTHPDIEATRLAMMEGYGKMHRVPTMHFEAQQEAVHA